MAASVGVGADAPGQCGENRHQADGNQDLHPSEPQVGADPIAWATATGQLM